MKISILPQPRGRLASTYCIKASDEKLPPDRYQIILLGDRGTCVNNLPKVVTWKWNGRESNPGHDQAIESLNLGTPSAPVP